MILVEKEEEKYCKLRFYRVLGRVFDCINSRYVTILYFVNALKIFAGSSTSSFWMWIEELYEHQSWYKFSANTICASLWKDKNWDTVHSCTLLGVSFLTKSSTIYPSCHLPKCFKHTISENQTKMSPEEGALKSLPAYPSVNFWKEQCHDSS